MAALAQFVHELSRSREGLDFVDQLAVQLSLGRPHLLSVAQFELLARHGGHDLIRAHADMPVDPPHGYHGPVLAERPKPSDRVLVVGIDQRSVDIEDRYGLDHKLPLPEERLAETRVKLRAGLACSRPSAEAAARRASAKFRSGRLS